MENLNAVQCRKLYLIGLMCLIIYACQNNTKEYPKEIIENNLTEHYDKALWELYKINSLKEFGRVDYVINFDEEVEDKIYTFDSLKGYYSIDRSLLNSMDSLLKSFPNKVKYYVECELAYLSHERYPLQYNDTTRMTFFPVFDKLDRLQKISGTQYHTIYFINDTICELGFGDGKSIEFSEKYLNLKENDFIKYLENKEDILTNTLKNQLEKRKAD